jgi:Protein of unknown function (DUF3300)
MVGFFKRFRQELPNGQRGDYASLPAIAAVVIVAALIASCQAAPTAHNRAPPTLLSAGPPAKRVTPPSDAAHWDQLTAPIALYSDPLLAQVLVASMYTAQISQAARWVAGIPTAQLANEVSGASLQRKNWDPSVKSLIAVPAVLNMMSAHPRWSDQLGDAFRSHPAAVMDSVQRLRRWALDYGVLRSTSEQVVSDDGVVVSIEPAQPDTIYVSYYQPEFVYGSWPWLGTPPYSFQPTPPYSFQPPDHFILGGAPIAFGIPVNVTAVPWRWYQWHWRQHRLEVLTGSADQSLPLS